MILVTGGTGFIGRTLIRQLVSGGREIRILIHPSRHSPNLPKGIPVEAVVCSLSDERVLRSAMKGVDTVYHLAGAERAGSRGDLMAVDIRGTQAVAQAAAQSGVGRFFYLSHIGADRASAYPILKAKAIAENSIRQSGVTFTILRTGVVFGPQDGFTTRLAELLRSVPGIFLLPGDGRMLLQPLWVEDLVTCLVWALDDPATCNQLYTIGGVDILSFKQIIEIIRDIMGIRRQLVPFSPAYLRSLTVLMEHTLPRFPLSIFLLDYLAADRTCPVDTIPRIFGLLPSRFSQQLDYLAAQTRAEKRRQNRKSIDQK